MTRTTHPHVSRHRAWPAGVALIAGLCWIGGATAAPPDPTLAGEAPPASGPDTGLPPGAIIAFMPRFGDDYADAAGLDRWLAARGFVICDGRQGTPDLRERMLLGTATAARAGEALGSREHDHLARGETSDPVWRGRATQTGREQSVQLPDDQHRHHVDLRTTASAHLPPSLRVLFIMKLR